jgi:tRNA(fMet)-specific endonuclease VapC
MKYLLDTCVVSDFAKGNLITLHKIKESQPKDLAVSSITLMEIYYGLALNPHQTNKLKPILLDFLGMISIIPFTNIQAEIAAHIRTNLKKSVLPIGSYDILIAACALEQELVLVTANTGEFMRIDQLRLENWRG